MDRSSRELTLTKNLSGRGNPSYKLTLPNSWVMEMFDESDEEPKKVKVAFDGTIILIKKLSK